jgi:catechol 2,3-dioxygenase-like lactoylglutathione lyase family enzyme
LSLHHVSLEVPTADVERTIEFWELIGFSRIEAPEEVAPYVTWLERESHQIHLIHTDAAAVPTLGHAAVVTVDFDATLGRLRDGGFEVAESRELWGERRAFAVGPAGHRGELMAAPPPPAS